MIDEIVLGKTATIMCSNERGIIIGYAVFEDQNPQMLIRYKAADGRAVEQWWYASAVVF